MKSLFKNMSLIPKGLRYKTMIAFSLMALIPLLICVWIVTTYIFPNISILQGLSLGNISLILVISIVISILGLYITRGMIDPVIKIASEAKIIANGDVDRVIEVSCEDEIGDLGASLNTMTQKIKDNIEELKAYSERTKLINIEINKKVLALSSLLQIGNLISSSSELPAVLDFISQKASEVEDDCVSFVMLLDRDSGEFKVASSYNLDKKKAEELAIKEGTVPRIVVIDGIAQRAQGETLDKVLAPLDLKNIVMLPIVVSKKQYGIFAIGNKKECFSFKDDDMEVLKIFVRQASIAIENDLLIKKARELSITDELTGLYNRNYIHTRLNEEIKRACIYQRPCAYLLIDIDDFKNLHERIGESGTVILLKALGRVLKDTVTDVDKVARLKADRFAIVLPERNKKQAASIAEGIRGKIESGLGKIMKTTGKLTISIGVSENPIDGSNADELMEKAERLLKSAKSLGKNRVAV